MIDYDPHDWRSHLCDIRGSLFREILPRTLLVTLWAAVLVVIDQQLRYKGFHGLAVKPTVHTLMGVALSLLLVFRTNSSYDRFWEGRKLWGGIVNEARNLARSACVLLQAAPELKRTVVYTTIGFAYASMHQLRLGSRKPRRREAACIPDARAAFGPLCSLLSPEEQQALLTADHTPLAVATRITAALNQARDQGLLSDYLFTSIDHNVQCLVDYLGGCERIHRTPLPFVYMVHLRRALIVYCYTVPFALLEDFRWGAVGITFAVAYLFLGIEEIGVEIEDPFGLDENDLPQERICATISSNLLALLDEPDTTPPVGQA